MRLCHCLVCVPRLAGHVCPGPRLCLPSLQDPDTRAGSPLCPQRQAPRSLWPWWMDTRPLWCSHVSCRATSVTPLLPPGHLRVRVVRLLDQHRGPGWLRWWARRTAGAELGRAQGLPQRLCRPFLLPGRPGLPCGQLTHLPASGTHSGTRWPSPSRWPGPGRLNEWGQAPVAGGWGCGRDSRASGPTLLRRHLFPCSQGTPRVAQDVSEGKQGRLGSCPGPPQPPGLAPDRTRAPAPTRVEAGFTRTRGPPGQALGRGGRRGGGLLPQLVPALSRPCGSSWGGSGSSLGLPLSDCLQPLIPDSHLGCRGGGWGRGR